MNIQLKPSFELTTEHPSSSYGMPVLLDKQKNCYGPRDIVKAYASWPHLLAVDVVARLAKQNNNFDNVLVQKFIK